ncbi:hypothetical protein ADK53_05615 [Streptomyces sp. WM6373]|nr:hypothetical protein ADK53_05615 [Streptomyces sp. WM6373]KOU76317.1 hypothetical protein ADK96_01745 [Streptomyces sp. IGB124]KOU91072.1 hypothetical protein ADK93_08305 [Streptomyces sp. XY58]KOV12851.1 hypothetical protein ADK89_01285 [Streptomyces sp. XY37]KOV15950.1 hypothetical protein ADK90_29410 [Streptomyces sp. XY413]KOV56595.1 hypothetical protein ADK99_00785 [Streptomyces sp. MMG1064]
MIGAARTAPVRQAGRMQLRRALPLTLAAIVMASGCVTVRPAPAPEAPQPAPAPAGKAGRQPREPTAAARPLVRLPAVGAAEAAPETTGPVPVPASEPRRAAGGMAPHRPALPPRRARAKTPRAAQPAKRAEPAPRAKARRQSAAAAKSRPAPGRSYDMAPLCEAAKGTVSPAIVALCR